MSAFTNSGHSFRGNSWISTGRFRPEADVWFVHPIMVYTKLARCKALPGRHWNSVRHLYSKSHRFVSCPPWCRAVGISMTLT